MGLVAAGSVTSSLIGRLPSRAGIGPVAGVSYRVARRIANSLRAGFAVRNAHELESARTILFHSPLDQTAALLEILRTAKIDWAGRYIIFCDCESIGSAMTEFRSRGASVATLSACAIPGCVALEGEHPALRVARGLARQLALRPIEIRDGRGDCFQAAITLGSGALTPLIDHTAGLLRDCGVRDKEAPALAAALFEKSIKDYAHSGRQSWSWYVHEPDPACLESQIVAVEDDFQALFRTLIVRGFRAFGRHPSVLKRLSPPEDL